MFVQFNLLDLAALHMDNTVRHRAECQVVRDNDHRHVVLAAGFLQQLQDQLASVVVQRARRLVAEQQLRIFRQRAGDCHTLLLATGKLRREIVLARRQTNLVQHRRWIRRILADLRLEFETRTDVTVPEYIEMIRLKTSVLLSAALKIGAVLGDASEEDARKLYDFGIQMGLAFQLQDDYLDVYGDPKVFGKNIGGDILCNKKTFMLINALALGNPRQKEELDRWISCAEYCPEEKIKAVTGIYNEIGIDKICDEKINEYYAKGLALLDGVSLPAERKEELKSFVCRLMNRKV